MIMRRTSVVVQGRNDGSVDDARLVIGAGGSSVKNVVLKTANQILVTACCDYMHLLYVYSMQITEQVWTKLGT